MRFLDRRPWLWLLLGVALVALANTRFGIGVLGWVASVPFLRYLRLRSGPRAALAVLGASVVAWSLAVAKIVTAPLSLAMVPMFAVPIALTAALPTIAYAALRRRLGGAVVPLLFPAAMVVGEWVQHAATPFGSWGAAAYTQLDLLPLLQVASVAGLAGPSLLVHLVNVAVDEALERGAAAGRLVAAAGGLVAAAFAFGQVRLAANDAAEDTVRVAAVGTDATFGGLPLPAPEERAAIDEGLERRTRQAAAAGAAAIVWTEAAAMALPDEEDAWLVRWRHLARELGVHLAIAYVVPVATGPLLYENKAVVLGPDGAPALTWLKHEPVPGEPAVAGVGMPDPVDHGGTRLGAALCYDGDFPRLGLALAGQRLDLLALPSSDWRGVDPIHTDMARLRAVEGGYGVVRSTRFGRSAAIDALGRVRGAEDAFDGGDRVLVAELPAQGVRTVYATLGDWLVALCAAVLASGGLRALAPAVDSRPWPRSSASPAARS